MFTNTFAAARAFSIECRRKTSIVLVFGMIFATGFFSDRAQADLMVYFADVEGTPTGEFGWDDFGLTGSPYQGPHAPDKFGSSTSNITANPGGIITSTNNLYSFFTVPEWSVNLNDLVVSESYTSLAVQFATSSSYSAGQFSLAGNAPDEFEFVGAGPESGGFALNIYWAEWQGLNASTSYSVELTGTGQHQSLAGVKASYFNTSDSNLNISRSVPEPGSLGMLASLLGIISLRRRQGRS